MPADDDAEGLFASVSQVAGKATTDHPRSTGRDLSGVSSICPLSTGGERLGWTHFLSYNPGKGRRIKPSVRDIRLSQDEHVASVADVASV